ncbi:iron-containing alcohol dehydrogenase [Acutalibacter muris]|uniref:Iron-containing alcohol dehydrogenase n=2 Tax=Acutalibacter muris TaxID=1796620 RepID=A0A1Z2XQ05_9FIRM|nr:iron-containing alcohol dehydrogenase [Acutalibacter muris]ANU52798.1 hypothetical protein A4V00_01490 [Hungateiclostridiaceae bacterium KB18]ASB40537.1 hypothetical protein ADH66_07590 [Acutalibacter muris]QQR29819.1 iron-containing alcohol dehydrogenase [Acutalibacter muris]
MKNFFYHAPVKVLFGEGGVERHLGMELRAYGKNIMLAYGGGSVKRSGLYDQLTGILEQAGKTVIDFGGITSNPTYDMVLKGVETVRREKVDFILAVGGGSVMDCVKVISTAAKASGDYWKLIFEDHYYPMSGTPWGAIVTLSGTGSEMNGLGGISNKALNTKATLPGSPASFAICDPTYLLTVPQKQLASGIFDNLSHCMETYFGPGECVSDAMNEAVMHDIIENARAWRKDPTNIDILGNLMWDSSLPQTFLFNCGKEGGFQCHPIEAQLCAYTGSNHGMALAVIHPSYYRHIVKDMPEKFARFGQRVFDLDPAGKTTQQLADEAVEAVADFVKELGLDSSFTELGLKVDEDILRKVAENCGVNESMPRVLPREEIFQMLREVM